jgi:hypothetical protein
MKIPLFALPHRVTIIPFKGSGAYGKIYETDEAKFQKNVPCRIEPKIQRVQGRDGDDVIQQAEGTFPPDAKIRAGDKIKWELGAAEYEVGTMIPIDAMGPHSIEVILT